MDVEKMWQGLIAPNSVGECGFGSAALGRNVDDENEDDADDNDNDNYDDDWYMDMDYCTNVRNYHDIIIVWSGNYLYHSSLVS